MPSPAPTPTSESPAAPRETPLFFDSGERPLYAVHHAPARPRPGAPVALFCHSIGVEQLTTYRNDVLAARAAAALGVPAFRYHARGHGDSGGDFADVTLERMVDDACAAAAEARRRSGACEVVWIATRFGALVAAAAIRREGGARALALWEPVHRPSEYFRGWLRGRLFSEVAQGRTPEATVDELLERVRRDGEVDVHGYYLHRTLYDSAIDADLGRALEGWRGPTLIAQIAGRPRLAPAHARLARALEAAGGRVSTLEIAEEPGWHFVSNPAWQWPALVAGTREWLDAVA